MVDNFREHATVIQHTPGYAIEGDKILVWCRKKDPWIKARGSEQHHYFHTTLSKNAFAVINRSFKNLQK